MLRPLCFAKWDRYFYFSGQQWLRCPRRTVATTRCRKKARFAAVFPSQGEWRQRGTRGVEEPLAPCLSAHSIKYCEQGIDGAAPHGAERRVAFNAVRLPIRRIVGQYGDVARAALCAFERDGSIFARDRLVVL